MEQTNTYLKTVPFTDFLLWDVKRYNHVFNSNFENAVFLKDILTPYKEKLSKEELIENDWRIIKKINFQGELFLRDKEEVESYKGSLNKVPDNSIIYSKINVRHGCIYYHKTGEVPFGVSSEYPTFTFNETKADGKYLMLVLRSNEFKRLLNTKASGISKARVKVYEFLSIKIPLPSLQDQKRIVAQYQQKIELAQQQEQEAKNLENEIEKYLFKELDVKQNLGQEVQKGIQTVTYNSIVKWSLDDIFKKNSIKSEKYPLVTIDSVCSKITDGTHQTPKYFDEGIIFLSAKNVTKEVIDWKNIKYISQDAHKGYTKIIKPEINDILLAKNGTTGVAAIVEEEKKFSIYVSLALLRPITEKVVPHYLLRVINSDIARIQFASRLIGIGVPNLHLGEIREVKIPLPPKNVQLKIANKISEEKREIKSLKTIAKQNREQALFDFEQEIFKP